MAREIPEVVRAAAGLAATVLDEARKLPETLPGIPVRLIGMAMQHVMKVQQQYAGLVARGDELFTGLRGESEPGLATFDDDEVDPVTVTQPSNGYRESAFDRAGETFSVDETLSDDEVEALPADPPADAVTAVVDELAEQVETGRQSIEEIADEAPVIEEILDEIAIDELVDQAPTLDETSTEAAALSLVQDAPATEDADALESALLESDDSPAASTPAEPERTSDVSTDVDVLTPDGQIATVEAAVTDEGIAAPEEPEAGSTAESTSGSAAEAPAKPKKAAKATKPRKSAKGKAGKAAAATTTDSGTPDTAATDTTATDTTATDTTATDTTTSDSAATDTDAGPATATDESGSEVAAAGVRTDGGAGDAQGTGEESGSAAASAPIDGYDSFSIAQLRGRLRGYALSTVQDLLSYEEATRAREPYLRLLRNRLEKLEQQAVESSPLAPRGT